MGSIPNMVQVAATTTKEARGTPAIPLLVNINTSNMVSCVPISKCFPCDCAIAILAKVIYIMLPSKLKEYPSGNIKDTILSLQPKRSSTSVNFGKTASLLVVLKAIIKGLEIILISDGILFPRIINPTPIKTIHKTPIPVKKYRKYLI